MADAVEAANYWKFAGAGEVVAGGELFVYRLVSRILSSAAARMSGVCFRAPGARGLGRIIAFPSRELTGDGIE